jgi:hypothetical protein
LAASDILPTVRQARGSKQHGSVTVGLTPVVLQAADDDLLSFLLYCAGPGKAYSGTSAVASNNTPPVNVGGNKTYEHSVDAIYVVADQADTVVLWEREVEV